MFRDMHASGKLTVIMREKIESPSWALLGCWPEQDRDGIRNRSCQYYYR